MPKPVHLGRRPRFRFSLVLRLKTPHWRRRPARYVSACSGVRFVAQRVRRRAVWIGGPLLLLYWRTRPAKRQAAKVRARARLRFGCQTDGR